MKLAVGDRLGPYEVVGPLGAGGMGEVYRARDGRLGREVAVKVLSERLARDPGALARFEREARAVAALSHPNIVALYDFGREGESVYAISELLQGESLRQRLAAGPLPPRKVAELGAQAARGLAAAHERGIVHRDVKPDNLFLTRDGHLKILDFGLAGEDARAASGDATQSPTMTRHTDPGTVMGTVGYMAPEQVRGEPADARSDLFSLGAALWEAAAGEAPFRRATAAETMTAILREEPAEPADTGRRLPPELERVLRHCLEKRPEERFQSARDLAFDLGRLQEGSAATAAQRPVLARAAQRRRWLVPAAVLLLAAFAAGWLVARRTAAPAAPPVKVRPLTFSGQDFTPTASADGRLVAFTSQRDGRPRIWLLDLVTGGEQPLTAGPDHFAAFSPDGSSILFRRDREDGGDLYRQSLVGGQLHRVVGDALAGVWSPDGARLAFVRARRGDGGDVVSSLFTADAAGRGETLLAEVPREAITAPRFSPDGSRLVATVLSASNLALGGRFIVVDVATGAVRDVQPPRRAILSSAVWSADGRELLYAFSEETTAGISGGNNLAVWQPLRGGSPRPQFWLRDLFGGGAVGSGRMAPAGPGRLVFEARVLRASLQELPLDSLAGAGSPRSLTAGASVDRQPVYSPDGGTLLFSSNRGGNLDLWQLALDSGALRRVTDDPAADWDPAFSPDGSAILWSSDRGGNLEVWMANADGSGARQVTRDGVDAENPTMTADGQWIVYASGNAAHPGVWKVRPDGSEATRLYGGNVFIPEVSPDGRHALFVEARPYAASNRLRALEVGSGRLLDFQVEVPRGASATGTLAENAGRPRWVDDGRIAFTGARPDGGLAVFVQDFRPGRDTSASRMEVSGPKREAGAESFDVSPDGRRLTVAWLQEERTVMLAEGVPGVGEER